MLPKYGYDAYKIIFYLRVFRCTYFLSEITNKLLVERVIFRRVLEITQRPEYSDPFVQGYKKIIQLINDYKREASEPTILNENFKNALDRLYNSILDPWRIKFFAQLNFHTQLNNLEQEFMIMLSSAERVFDSWIRDYRVMFSAARCAEHVDPLQTEQGETVIQHIGSLWSRLDQVPVPPWQQEAKERVLRALSFMAADFRQNMPDPNTLPKWWEVPP